MVNYFFNFYGEVMDTVHEKPAKLEKSTKLLASVVKRLGNPVSALLLTSPCSTFTTPKIDGMIGYQLVNNCAIVMGDPMCKLHEIPDLTAAFHQFCQEQNLSIIYFLASESFSQWAIHHRCKVLIQVGEKLILNPLSFAKKQKLRWKVNQSLLQGVKVSEYKDKDPNLEKRMQESIDLWINSKQGAQIFVGGKPNPFPIDENKRVFYATYGDKVVGLVVLSRLDQYQGWVIIAYFATPHAPVGVTEHLMCAVFETLAHEACPYVCLGAVSGSALGKVLGMSPLGKLCARCIFAFSRWFYQFETRKIYFKKYRPSFQPTYLLFDEKLSIRDLLALQKIIKH